MTSLIKISMTLFLYMMLSTNNAFSATSTKVVYKGINIAGAEFNHKKKNAKHFKDYIWPTNKILKEVHEYGFNTIRVPFSWDRLQPQLLSGLNQDELKQLDRVVQQSHMLGMMVILDPHNYGAYKQKVLTDSPLDLKVFGNLWRRLANRYINYPNVIYGLMNEPVEASPVVWAKIAQAGIDQIRQTGSTQLILVPGTFWSGMHSWLNKKNGVSNASALLGIFDSADNYAYEMHQYFDNNSSGTHNTCISKDEVINKFKRTTRWLRENNKNAFLAEFGVAENKNCIEVLASVMRYLELNRNEWIGWTYWTAGDWMPNYPFNILSPKHKNNERLKIIRSHLQ